MEVGLPKLHTANNPSLGFQKGKSQVKIFNTFWNWNFGAGWVLEEKNVTLNLLVRNSYHLHPRSLMETRDTYPVIHPLAKPHWNSVIVQQVPFSTLVFTQSRREQKTSSCMTYGGGREAARALLHPPCSMVSFKVINLPFLPRPQRGYRQLGMSGTGMWLCCDCGTWL